MDMTEIRNFEHPARVKKLSELIREGAKLRPQNLRGGCYFSNGKSCALGAAYEAATGRYGNELAGIYIKETLHVPVDLGVEITQMNDSGATREQCADYAESMGF